MLTTKFNVPKATGPFKAREIDSNILGTLGESSGYSIEDIIHEIVDNSSDSNSQNVRMTYSDSQGMLCISDDGDGMTADELLNYVKFGPAFSNSKSDSDKIGQYGMGAKTSLSSAAEFGSEITVISTKKGSNVTYMTSLPMGSVKSTDVERVCDKDIPAEHQKSGGTTIYLTLKKEYRGNFRNPDNLILDLGQAFGGYNSSTNAQNRTFNIYVQGIKAQPIDPLYRDILKSDLNTEIIRYTNKNGQEKKAILRYVKMDSIDKKNECILQKSLNSWDLGQNSVSNLLTAKHSGLFLRDPQGRYYSFGGNWNKVIGGGGDFGQHAGFRLELELETDEINTITMWNKTLDISYIFKKDNFKEISKRIKDHILKDPQFFSFERDSSIVGQIRKSFKTLNIDTSVVQYKDLTTCTPSEKLEFNRVGNKFVGYFYNQLSNTGCVVVDSSKANTLSYKNPGVPVSWAIGFSIVCHKNELNNEKEINNSLRAMLA